MAWEIKDKNGDTVKTGGKLEESEPPKTKDGLTDYTDEPSMPEPPHFKYDQR